MNDTGFCRDTQEAIMNHRLKPNSREILRYSLQISPREYEGIRVGWMIQTLIIN